MRPISLWVCNMNKEPICLIYDSELEYYNTAFDITITTQRNGAKTLDFSIRDSGEDTEPLINLLGINKEIETIQGTNIMRLGQDWIDACNSLPRNTPICWHRNVVNKTTSYSDSIRITANSVTRTFYPGQLENLPVGEVTDVRLYYNTSSETSTEVQYYNNIRFSYSTEEYEYNAHNWRLSYLVPEYFIKATTEEGDDYFIITNDSIAHNKRSKQINITCQHGSMLLKYMCLDKEYDGTEEKCIGTAQQLMESVLDGTTWTYDAEHSDTFYEKKIFGDNIEKKRTLKAAVKTGAFGIISKIADLFEAKPIYNADTKTVILKKMNPFELDVEGKPTLSAGDSVLELNYGYNVKNVTRTRNTESMVTRLNVQGAFGDTTLGYCGIEETKAYKHILKANSEGATVYKFTVNDAIDNKIKTYYVYMSGHSKTDVLEFYMIDRASESYLFNATKSTEDNPVIYKILPDQNLTIASTYNLVLQSTEEIDPRLFNFLMDYTYYRENHMLSDNALKEIANYQVYGRGYLQTIKEKTAQYNEDYSALSKIIGTVNYNRVAIDSFAAEDGYLKINLDLINYPDNGIIYTTEIDELRRNWFTWRTTTGIDKYGDAITSGASVVYLVHKTTGYDRLYIKTINYTDATNKVISSIVLYTTKAAASFSPSDYELYIFQNSTTGGILSARESEIEAAKNSLISATTYCGIYHPVYWEDDNDATSASVPTEYWAWKIVSHNTTGTVGTSSDLYCCCPALFGDVTYRPCASGTMAEPIGGGWVDDYDYIYNYITGTHWVKISGVWTKVYDDNETYSTTKILKKRFAEEFTNVWIKKLTVDNSSIGLYEKYRYNVTSTIPKGMHLFMLIDWSHYILFTTDVAIQSGKYLEFHTDDNYIYTDQLISPNSNILTTKVLNIDAVTNYKSNEIVSFSPGGVDNSTGACIVDTTKQRTGFITLYDGQTYINNSAFAIDIYLYDKAKTFLTHLTLAANATTIINGAEFCRVVTDAGKTVAETLFRRYQYWRHILYKAGGVFTDYMMLTGWTNIGDRKGLTTQFKKFLNYTDAIYNPDTGDLKQIEEAQDAHDLKLEAMVDALGPIYKQGYWADSNYVDGDEERLLADSFENLDEIAKPKTTYQVQFVDLYNAEHQKFLYQLNDSGDDWPDITINTAIHLIDDELNIQQWAYLDLLKKCYDDPRKTQITINTNLSDIAQATFQDVMQNIVSVADETKYKSEIYNRAESLSSKGVIAEKISGTLSTGITNIESGDSSWTTDERGNMIFKSTNGSGRMKITGDGLLVAASVDEYGKPIWRTAITGTGISADEINTGTLRANVIEAGGITTNQLSAAVGEELDISSNTSLLLFATVDGSRIWILKQQCLIKNLLNCWEPLREFILQRTDEISRIVKV